MKYDFIAHNPYNHTVTLRTANGLIELSEEEALSDPPAAAALPAGVLTTICRATSTPKSPRKAPPKI